MPNRRLFLKKASQFLIGSSLIPNGIQQDSIPPIHSFNNPDDYWRVIRKNFSLEYTRAFMNCATLGPSPQSVNQRIIEVMQYMSSTGEMSHELGEVRQRIAQFVGVNTDEIVLTKNTTEGINIIANGLNLKKGDEIILTNHEHVGNGVPWLNRYQYNHLKIKVLDINGSDDEILTRLKKLLSSKTKVIAVPHITCTTGRLLPIKAICKIAQSKGISTCIDGAHGVGMLNLNLHDLGCDFYATCCHKWLLGTKGTGFLFIKKDQLNKVRPLFVGANTHTGWDITPQNVYLNASKATAERFDYGTYNYASWAGVAAAIDFMESIGKDVVENRIKQLNQYLLNNLLEIGAQKIQILNPTEGVALTGIMGFKILNKDSHTFYENVFQHYRLRFVPESQLNSIRVSTHVFNTFEEIDGLVRMLKDFI